MLLKNKPSRGKKEFNLLRPFDKRIMGGRLFCTEKLNLLTKEVSIIPTLLPSGGVLLFSVCFFITFPLTKGKRNQVPWTRPGPASKKLEACQIFFGSEGDGRQKDQLNYFLGGGSP